MIAGIFYAIIIVIVNLAAFSLIGATPAHLLKCIRGNLLIAPIVFLAAMIFCTGADLRPFTIAATLILPFAYVIQLIKTASVWGCRKNSYIAGQNMLFYTSFYSVVANIIWQENAFNVHRFMKWDIFNNLKHPIAFAILGGIFLILSFSYNIAILSFMGKCSKIIKMLTYTNLSGLWSKLDIAIMDKKNTKEITGKRDLLKAVVSKMIKKEEIIETTLDGDTIYFHPEYFYSTKEKTFDRFTMSLSLESHPLLNEKIKTRISYLNVISWFIAKYASDDIMAKSIFKNYVKVLLNDGAEFQTKEEKNHAKNLKNLLQVHIKNFKLFSFRYILICD